MNNNIWEERWFEEKNKSVRELTNLIKKAPSILKKYKFDKIQSDIISKLLKSNDKFWYDIEVATECSRKIRNKIDNIEEKVLYLTNEVIQEKEKGIPNQDRIDFLLSELEYIGNNFNPDTNILITYKNVNKDYDDIELLFFFLEYAEIIDTFIENTMDKEGLLKKEEVFLEYIAKLFALSINNIGIEFKEDAISLKAVVENDEDMEELMKLND